MTISPPGPLDLDVNLPTGVTIDPGGVQFPPFASLDLTLDTPGGVLYAPTTIPVPDGLRLSIVNQAGTVLVPDLPKRAALSGSVPSDGTGTVSFNVRASALAEMQAPSATDLLDVNNRMVVWYGSQQIAEALMDGAPAGLEDDGDWTYSVSGRGSEAILDNGVLYPEVWKSNDERAFDFGSQTTPYSGWYVPGQWKTPVGVFVRQSFRWSTSNRHWPKGWPERYAKWIWSTSPEKGSADGPRWFRGILHLDATTLVRIYAAGDDTLLLKVDGNVVMRNQAGAWTKSKSVDLRLQAGDHVVAARVTNLPGITGTPSNRSGFLLAAGALNTQHQVTDWLLVTNVGQWKVASGDTPGWFPATVLWGHILEGQARGVEGYSAITRTFTDTLDSSGRPWPQRVDLTIPIGSSGTDVANVARAHRVNVAMLPGLRLAAYVSRGRDLRTLVSLGGQPKSNTWPSRVWSRIKTAVLTHGAAGWRDDNTQSTGLISEYGRREMFLSAGNAKSQTSMEYQGRAALRDAATPEQTIDVVTDSTKGPQPFVDYDIADLITVANKGRFFVARVMAIAFDEQDDKTVNWTTSVYPVYYPGQGGSL